MYRVAKIAVDKAAFHFDKLFSYIIPEEMSEKAAEGMRVVVPFGSSNRKRQGIIVEICEETPDVPLKPISEILDKKPMVSKELIDLSEYLADTSYVTRYEAIKAMLPSGINYDFKFTYAYNKEFDLENVKLSDVEKSIVLYLKDKDNFESENRLVDEFNLNGVAILKKLVKVGALMSNESVKRRIGDKTLMMTRLAVSDDEAEVLMGKLTEKQKKVIEFLLNNGTAAVKEILYYTSVTKAVCDTLERKGILEYYSGDVYRSPYEGYGEIERATDIVLSEVQEKAYLGLKQQYNSGKFSVSLLFGITGSGKTQVYLKLISHVISEGRGVIALMPEISLTPQAVEKFRKYFGERVALLHSALSVGERIDEWKRVESGEADIVIGTRSAVFAPVKNLGLIIIDEEQETTYKSENSPRYHARDIAKVRCRYNNSLLLLASATPSVESRYFAEKGRYSLYCLNKRYGGAILPDVNIVDMKEEQCAGNISPISFELAEEMKYNLENGEQTLLLINRRGYNTIIKCSECGEAATCPNCSIALTYHRANERVMCHYCGYSEDAGGVCSKCGSKYVRYDGVGTQRLEEEIKSMFPSARVLRMDADTTMAKSSYANSFRDFSDGKYDIMLGTQMIAKGLDFPNVTLVGVISADSSLFGNDFRSYERTFSLLTQVIGRCGRADKKGRAIIQTYSPENRIIEYASNQDYNGFFENEIANRSVMLYPPYCDMCEVGFSGEKESEVITASGYFMGAFKKIAAEKYPKMPLRAYGPVASGILKVSNKYRYKIIIKCKNNTEFRAFMSEILKQTEGIKEFKNINVYIDGNFSGIV